MRSYNCTPLSSPRLPPTYQHPMWQAWDLAVDHCLSQLPAIVDDGAAYRHSPFFADQLTAFQVWLTMGTERRDPPEQLPIVLQVLLSQVHRLRALDLLGRFLDLGPWAVSLAEHRTMAAFVLAVIVNDYTNGQALSVGIFPYVLKLLQSSARELRPLLVFIWAKILAVDSIAILVYLSRNTDSPDGAQLQLPHEIARPLAIRAGEQPPPSRPPNPAPIGSAIPHSSTFQSKRRLFDKGPNSTYDDDDDVSSPPSALITTEFCEWSSRYFAQSVMKFPEEHDPQSPVHYDREWRFIRNARVRREAREMQKRAVSMRLDDQIFINRNKANPTVVKFHPYDPHMAVADKDGISIWNWDQGARTNYFRNNNAINSRITALDFINAHDITLLLSGSDDGAVRIWREYGWDGECEPELVTAWQAISDLLPSTRGSGLVVDWEQESGMLLASGDVRIIRVWDTQKEKKLQDIPTGADSCVTSLVSDSVGRSLLIAGCGDGSVRLFDRRLAPNECRVMTLREHTGWVVKVFLQKGSEGNIISASVGGDLKFWDPRFSESVKTIQTSQGLASFDVHPQAEIFACGSANQFISLYTFVYGERKQKQ
uniref:Uncharacterized protein n=1 Tax=Branchiostoma floridae TaxID=7739 RepID=C3YJB3_BRAFL|eukprot:XP_002603600.1 hypothetical protein BRAFLDRAFT_126916 [Branchiostoma floridae]